MNASHCSFMQGTSMTTRTVYAMNVFISEILYISRSILFPHPERGNVSLRMREQPGGTPHSIQHSFLL
jgi:hypothetical protein